MEKKIQSALISVFYKDGLEPLVKTLSEQNVTIYSTGGTQKFIEDLGIKCVPVESLTTYPSILGGRVKTLHPAVFGGILGRRDNVQDIQEMKEYNIPEIDLVIVDLYPFEETLKQTNEEKLIIEKIDIGGPSMIRAAAKNFKDLVVISDKNDYSSLVEILQNQNGATTLEQRKSFAAKAFEVAMNYDIAINNYFNGTIFQPLKNKISLRYGENPHQNGSFFGNLNEVFTQLNGKELSYNNLVDADGAIQLISEFEDEQDAVFAIFKHTNVCGISIRKTLKEAWDAALAGDPESAFGGVIITNKNIDAETANAINEIFFEVLVAPAFDEDALAILKSKKNRILLQINPQYSIANNQYKSVLNGTLVQDTDKGNFAEWKEVGGRTTTEAEQKELAFANIVCKHLKSNAIALIKDLQLVGKGCGQTSRVDALRHSIEKAKQFAFDLHGAVLASDAFFPFDDCVKIAHAAGIEAFIQPGGSIRDKDSIAYAVEKNLAMVLTNQRHFRH
ncbi:bifunctional phosphoribosylaminoimidazolecarboxamide formyltransferase/IMP cyclohydrolase [Arachidicoccus ginsenosidimutans]|uniref:bifunctional phosphoribosylaminoimidazolecarboxamide formyltransferase/IMP cyclohydrolase n=1 Tax=Arachidicoccus sp. BS20 TaxID=1850526 RepID=UPI0007F149A9|nr:bifunctional phosphoribosylaminoimidazolecarboxamide formyltransferase/IMP cyclohydrolase [Arachidicoccus sp. BS20]ANI89034.1 bifunctional phosphoribosylaminoimidazolecarboxamide formyltransferase/IMP cyclohydrolase [Arachidicoccus sp. BS20]